ncbi:MAG: iron-containing alcohol dehydrogenase, partial [Promethearchaeota archaeon]
CIKNWKTDVKMSLRDKAWYEDPKLKNLYLKASSNAMRGYHAPLISPLITFTGTNSLIDLINLLGAFLLPEEKRILIVVDKDLRKFGERVAEKLKSSKQIDSKIFDNVLPEAPRSSVMLGVEMCKEYDPKIMIAIGGGSAMDTAKMIMLLYEQPNINLNNVMAPTYAGLRKKIYRLVAIPTTSGTGSEATYNAVLSDTDRDPPKKTSVPLYELIPDYVVLHTDFVKTMPPYLTMGTGMDAFAHSIGAYVLTASNEFSDIHNLKAIELILKYLPRVMKRGNDIEARRKMQLAAYLAGVGFINTAGAGIEHSLGHSFGGLFHCHHGVAVGLFTPASVAFQAKVTNRFIELAKIFKIKTKGVDRDKILRNLLEKMVEFMNSVKAPTSIKELERPKVPYEDYTSKMEQMVDYAYNDFPTLSSSRKLDPLQIRKIYEITYENKIDDLMKLYYM